ncbi:MAG: hypothetical protein UT61_C0026G0009 [Candidatus Woesebacteria bacterium GW2011_GWA1_39_8]|uniref:Uncharacterized protein n=1 Tax=Candidatus Woesebacteria bacterium GW2011_GWA1_39_8 TaxID=1618552 RepID=A0A0G0SVN1_9BACT|nr:MAG: hypothetical protein UT61_C0026G0009 [Candidatus Woesebacteria bacterium GW2011_GWA1_39_8]
MGISQEVKDRGSASEDQIEATKEQYNSLVNRLAIPTPELPESTE